MGIGVEYAVECFWRAWEGKGKESEENQYNRCPQ
jgi:hypothetical protein